MGMELRYGRMERGMRESGTTTKHMAMENLYMWMVMYTKGSGLMIRPMVVEFIYTETEANMMVNGGTIYRMAKEARAGKITALTTDTTDQARNMGTEGTNGLTEAHTKVCGVRIRSQAKGYTHGQMVECSMANGLIITCMEKVLTLGRTVEDMRGSTASIKSMDMESTLGVMVEDMMGSGSMVNRTEKELILKATVIQDAEVSGMRVKDFDGQMMKFNVKFNNVI